MRFNTRSDSDGIGQTPFARIGLSHTITYHGTFNDAVRVLTGTQHRLKVRITMASKTDSTYKRLDRTTDTLADNGDRVRTYNVHRKSDDSIIGHVSEHWHADRFIDDASVGMIAGVVDMSLYKNSVNDGRRTFDAVAIVNGKRVNVDSGSTLASTIANVRKRVFGK